MMVDLICRAGKKLEAALDHFKIDVKGLNILDSGISTGGFSDCLLQRGAASLVGVDVGYGQVALCLQLASLLILKLCQVHWLRSRHSNKASIWLPERQD